MFGIEKKVEKAARKGAAFSAAALLGCVGAAFLTAAGWMVLSELRSDLFAATVIGALYLGAAAIAAAAGLKEPNRPAKAAQQQQQLPQDMTPLQMVVLSFLQGFEQGRHKDRSV
ncbi:hypothetical protein HKX54_07920 [Sulfitobacter sp. M57]|uniref:phage holin family protein n=1 Tax=unclassified Sulfitobacter TaxID=196795 RepID=UPI0023E113BD|nr:MULTISPECIES: phage holin family protein [unclassified Sulfitobacter]MDF3414379.1 hypothetical protein [Sulfitobacter sp. KE5]MDF3420339.1 hypothetical protein [Sulfitobacter sp. KE43]MDF3432925.1 hypothetical protein [Sulfitobacter sp. KE42]MDF3458565.1 hypothetical protein [Sulfitobacter sp. S74]MDF3462465.1 hypothetical protein [Sulfitobacter sp. Ks18]